MSNQLSSLAASDSFDALRFYAVDMDGATLRGNMIVVATPVPPSVTLSDIEPLLRDNLERTPRATYSTTDDEVDGQPARLFDVPMSIDASPPVSTRSQAWMFIREGFLYVVTVGCGEPAAESAAG